MADRLHGPDFALRDGALFVEAVPLARLAEEVGTPFYCYSSAALLANYRSFATALSHLPMTICYALKANSNLAVIKTLADDGAGADVVSEGELRRALAAGVPAERIVFSGVGKQRGEMAVALDAGIHQINVESEAELEVLSEVATAMDRIAKVAIRFNPDVDARTHNKISTGRRQDKFGVIQERLVPVYGRAHELPGIEPVGLAMHIGSQLLSVDPFRAAFERMAEMVTMVRAEGYVVDRVDLGGGMGIAYCDEAPIEIEAYVALVDEIIAPLGCDLAIEPGRAIAGNAGILATRALYIKQGGVRPIVVIDAAMNDLKRPAMYDAFHAIVPALAPPAGVGETEVDVVGPICETGDTFASRRFLPPIEAGDLLVMGSAGAYGAVMSSQYNSRLLIPEVLVAGDKFAVVRPRSTFERMLDAEVMPDWLTGNAGATQSQSRRGAA